MKRRKNENPVIRALTSRKTRLKRIFLLCVLLLVVYFYGFGDYGISRYLQLQKDVNALQYEISTLESETDQLREEEELLKKKDPEYLQKIAREKYGLVKPGEKIYKLVPKKDKD